MIASGGSPPPLHIVHEPDAAAYSWDEPISEMDYEELNDAEMLACKDEIKRRTAAGEMLPYALRASGNQNSASQFYAEFGS